MACKICRVWSFVNPCNALSNGLILDNADNAYLWHKNGSKTGSGGYGIWRAIEDRANNNFYLYAPEGMINTMTTAADPRMPVRFMYPSTELSMNKDNIPSVADAKVKVWRDKH
ncbi:MAG: hypothetical protein LBS52_04200 [Dysgonamonadaceae bacterium]|jgi:hypothetical protein|nr:hypothetical protein [Dysgonamonadaceae bacterium]